MAQRRPVHRRNPSVDMPKYPPQSQHALAEVQNQAQPIHLAQISDYDSDNQGYTSDFPSKPPPAPRTIDELNLSVLQRHNDGVTAVLFVAPYAVIYDFAPPPESAWVKNGIEGSLFICALKPGSLGEERYVVIVLNRRGLENFEVPLIEHEDAGVEISGEFVLMSLKKNDEIKVHGVYIFSEGPGKSTEHTREACAELMTNLAAVASTSRQNAERAAAEAREKQQNGHAQQAGDGLEDQNTGAPMGRQISLQQLFGQQRSQDASFSLRSHNNLDGASDDPPHQLNNQGPTQSMAQQQPDVIGDLFRKAGIAMR